MTRLSLRPAALCVALGSTIALAGFVPSTDAHEKTRADTGGLRCLIVTRDLGDAVDISGKVTSNHAASGLYSLSIRQTNAGGRAMIDQSGEFTVGEGRTVTLGQATLGGSAQSYRAELTVTVGDRHLRCESAGADTDI